MEDDDMDSQRLEQQHGVKDIILGVLPGLRSVKVGGAVFVGAVLTVILWTLACSPELTMKQSMGAGVVGLLIWSQSVGWLITGDLQNLVSSLADFEGAKWALFAALAGIPAALAWTLFGASLS